MIEYVIYAAILVAVVVVFVWHIVSCIKDAKRYNEYMSEREPANFQQSNYVPRFRNTPRRWSGRGQDLFGTDIETNLWC